MEKERNSLFFFGVLFLLMGCQTVGVPKPGQETSHDAAEALQAVAGALGGKNVSEADLKALNKQIQSDPQARSAVEAISGSYEEKKKMKYCPETGERFAVHLEYCPGSQTKLEWVE